MTMRYFPRILEVLLWVPVILVAGTLNPVSADVGHRIRLELAPFSVYEYHDVHVNYSEDDHGPAASFRAGWEVVIGRNFGIGVALGSMVALFGVTTISPVTTIRGILPLASGRLELFCQVEAGAAVVFTNDDFGWTGGWTVGGAVGASWAVSSKWRLGASLVPGRFATQQGISDAAWFGVLSFGGFLAAEYQFR